MLTFNMVPQTPRKLKWDYSMKKIAFYLKGFPALALVALLSGAPTMTCFAAQAQLCVIVSLHLQYEVQAEPAVCVVDNQLIHFARRHLCNAKSGFPVFH